MKRPILVFIIPIATLLLASCSREPGAINTSSGGVELTYWPAPNAQEMQLADSIVLEWNRIHPEIHVKMQPIPVSISTEEVLLAAIAGKTTPDVCSNIWPGALHDYTKSGGLVPLDSFSDFDSIASTRTPRELLETFRSDDHHYYQMPWKTNPVMMFYNTHMLEEAGVAGIPATYSEYFAAAEKFKHNRSSDGRTIWMGERDIRPIWWQRLFDYFPFYIAASSGRTLFDKGVVAFDNSYGSEVFAFFQECYVKQYFPRTYFQAGDPFLLEKKASDIAGAWEIATIMKFAPDLKFTVAPLPVPDDHKGPVYTYGDFENLNFQQHGGIPREAWEFVKFLVSAEHDLALLQVANQIAIRGDLLTNPLFAEYFKQNPLMVRFAKQAPYTRGMDAVPIGRKFSTSCHENPRRARFMAKKPPPKPCMMPPSERM